MAKTSAKNKIVLLSVSWFLVTLAMFFYFFGFLDASNQSILETLTKQNNDLAVLQAQKQSYAQGKTDLDKLAQQPLLLTDFFSRDITLVNEIKTLEDLGQKSGVKMQLSGISGLASTEPKASTKTSLVLVPYGINLYGNFAKVTDFIENLEHLDFITSVNSLSVSVADKGNVSANLSAELYIKN